MGMAFKGDDINHPLKINKNIYGFEMWIFPFYA